MHSTAHYRSTAFPIVDLTKGIELEDHEEQFTICPKPELKAFWGSIPLLLSCLFGETNRWEQVAIILP